MLTDENKIARYTMALSFRDPTNPSLYQDMMDMIHVDEKWFFLTQDKEKYLLTPSEEEPYCTVCHKSHITKVMFICAIAWPRYDEHLKEWWDGKLGIWPVGDMVETQRRSSIRPRGTLVWRNKSLTKEVYRSYICNKLLLAIWEKWPIHDKHRKKMIRIQHDNASSHISNDDPTFQEDTMGLGLKVLIMFQAANSLDVNLNDLGFFWAIQSATNTVMENEMQLIKHVKQAYDEYPHEKINNCWLTLMSVFNCIIEDGGGNNYKIPHLGKQKLKHQGWLPYVLEVTEHTADI
jgi:hypothetical protein